MFLCVWVICSHPIPYICETNLLESNNFLWENELQFLSSCRKGLKMAKTMTIRMKTSISFLVSPRFAAPLQLCCKFNDDGDSYNDNDDKLTSQM